jgi:hypothetical protein
VSEAKNVSEKEQAQALKLLAKLIACAQAGHLPPPDLIERAQAFLDLPTTPESHGQRRS